MREHKHIPALTADQERRLWSHIDRRGPDDCWLWTGGVTTAEFSRDYGIWYLSAELPHVRPHRVVWTLLNGPIPWPLTLDHVFGKCTSTLCCNPAHLELVTQGENIRRYYLSRTHCKRGHLIIVHGRSCKTCNTLRKREERASKAVQLVELAS